MDATTRLASSSTLEEVLAVADRRTVPGDDVDLAVAVWEGDEDVVVFAHATGFHKEIWAPTVRALRAMDVAATLVAVDLRGHGDSPEPDRGPSVWDYAGDVARVAETFGRRGRLVGVGHSLGGMAVAGCQARFGPFDAVVVIDPALLPPSAVEAMRTVGNPWAEAARRRRPGFETSEEACRTFAAKEVFSTWADGVLRLYVEHGFRQTRDGWMLKCRPAWEAATFSQEDFGEVWEAVEGLGGSVTLVTAEHSVTHPNELAEETADHLGADHVRLPGITHFVPMEAPEAVAVEVRRRLGR